MWQSPASIRRHNRQLARDSDIIARGLSSPPDGSSLPLSVSPAADSLAAFVAIDDEISSPSGSVSVRLSEFIRSGSKGKKRFFQREMGLGSGSRVEVDQEGRGLAGESSGDAYDVFPADDEWNSLSRVDENSCSNVGDTSEANSSSSVEDIESLLLRALMDQQEAEVLSPVPRVEILRNEQEQDDEIVALESIYDGSFKRLSDEQRCFMIEVSLEVTKEITVFMPPVRGRDRDSFTLQYLPPIHLACLLPNTYPSRTRPTFVLHSQWLSAEKLSQLSDELLKFWEGQKGDVVVYPWTEFLHSQGLSAIGASEEMELVPPQHHVNDPRVISRYTSVDNNALSLLRYNEDMQNRVFLSSFHPCSICFEEHVGKECIRFSCMHAYCRDCMQQYASVHVRDGSINNLKCPNTECKSTIPPSALKELLSKDDFERWEQLCLQKTLDAMIDVVYCPRCSTACIEDGDHQAQCGQCFYNFCSLCRGARHLGQECLTPEARLEILRRRQLQTEDQRRREEDLVNELKNLALVKQESVQCPVCKMAISKISGCSKMTCTNCGKYFCFRCGKRIQGYEHFRDGNCKLFDADDMGEDAQIWQLVQQHEEREQQRQEVGRFGKLCPSCGQQNAKVGNNNHITCISCQNHYCGQCLKIVRKASEHFGPNKCKQHSVDPPR